MQRDVETARLMCFYGVVECDNVQEREGERKRERERERETDKSDKGAS